MGYSSNHLVELAEEDYQEARNEQIYKDAAILILNGFSRDEAIGEAKRLDEQQKEALSNGNYSEDPETGFIDFFEDIGSPVAPKSKQHQVRAIVEELKNEFGL
jgi:hypothetical protein